MSWKPISLVLLSVALASAELPQLADLDKLSPKRRELIEKSLAALEQNPGIPYVYSGSSPSDGGMDCSGSMYYLMSLVGIDPPRTSQAQYEWVKEAGNLVEVPATATKATDSAFEKIQPGDLIFWAYLEEGKPPRISHVQMYLGKEAKDGRRVMIGSSDGRSYRGVKKNGFDIVDFQVPKAESNKRLIGYGPPQWRVRKK